jgi:hypothetical protein
MIKYTILYKNGKTWNGKVNRLYDLARPANDAVLLWVKGESGSSIYIPGVCSSWTNVPGTSTGKKPIRKPNPASITKKQKAFDKAYARWIEMQADLNQGRRLDISIKAYKKWLWEQKQAELKSVDVAKSITFSEPVEVPVNITINWDGIYKPWKEAAIKKYKTHSYDTPIKTTYTFWLGAFGEISDE